MPIHRHKSTHTQDPHQDHTASISRFLSSPPIDYCYILWLDWTTPDNISHRLYSFPAHLHPPTLTHSFPLFIPPPLPHQHPSCVCLSLAFISPAYWTPPLASKCDALMVWPLLDINPYLPPLHISMLTNNLQCLPFFGHNNTYCTVYSHWTDLFTVPCGLWDKQEAFQLLCNKFSFLLSICPRKQG